MTSDAYASNAICDTDCQCDVNACGCNVGKGTLFWDPDLCLWIGNVICGSITVDLIIELKKVSGACKMCVTSTCLGKTGEGSDCYDYDTCGDYNDGCLSPGERDGLEFTFTGDISTGCGDNDCTTAEFTISCRNYTNPQPLAGDTCPDCDCVCECVCLTYCEDDGTECCELQKACWDHDNGRFQATFDGNCSWSDQTATITMVKVNGCCYWNLAVSRGTITSAESVPADCPYPTVSWTGTDGENTWSLEMECTGCDDDCGDIPNGCCDNDFPYTLYAKICDSTSCNCDSCIALSLVELSPSPTWRGTATICCEEIPECQSFDVDIEVVCEPGNIFTISLYCNGDSTVNVGGTADSATCSPICLQKTLNVVHIPASACSNYPCGTVSSASIEVCVSETPCP